LPDVDSEWVAELSQRLTRTRVRALQALVEVWRQKEDAELMRGDSLRLLELEPLNEHAHAGVIEAALMQGHAAEGLRAYEACRKALSAEVGAHPGAVVQELYERLLAVT
jgi:DNA-binding SARP family transcriptional activator